MSDKKRPKTAEEAAAEFNRALREFGDALVSVYLETARKINAAWKRGRAK